MATELLTVCPHEIRHCIAGDLKNQQPINFSSQNSRSSQMRHVLCYIGMQTARLTDNGDKKKRHALNEAHTHVLKLGSDVQ
jgi:hypothetical protein